MLKKLGYGLRTGCSTEDEVSPYLDGVLASTVLDLDATIAASYSGSGQVWANLIVSPADGAAQTDYDMYLGAGSGSSTDDPTFTGSADDPAAYFAMDGGDHFSLKSGVNTNFLKNLHKTTGGTDWWMAATVKSVNFTNANILFATQSGTTGIGLRAQFNINEGLTHVQRGGTANATATSTIATGTNNETIAIVSHSHAANTTRFWISRAGATGTAEEIAHTYNTTTSDPSAVFALSLFASGFQLENGVRVYGFAMGNEYLDNTKAAAIITHLETRHGRDYTP